MLASTRSNWQRMAGYGSRIMDSWRDRLNRSSDEIAALREVRDWYRRWVQVRELRYRYLAEILDDVEELRLGRHSQRGSADPSADAGSAQRMGASLTDTGGFSRRASPQVVRSMSASRSEAVSCASEDEVC
jgi:hypothetical protein